MIKRGVKRYINTSLWDDEYIRTMLVSNKDYYAFILWQLLLTYPKSHISGVFPITYDHIQFYTGFSRQEVKRCITAFEADNKIMYRRGWIGIRNFILHQTPNANMKKSIIHGLLEAPIEIVKWILENPDTEREIKTYPDDGYYLVVERILDHERRERELQDEAALQREHNQKKLSVVSL